MSHLEIGVRALRNHTRDVLAAVVYGIPAVTQDGDFDEMRQAHEPPRVARV